MPPAHRAPAAYLAPFGRGGAAGRLAPETLEGGQRTCRPARPPAAHPARAAHRAAPGRVRSPASSGCRGRRPTTCSRCCGTPASSPTSRRSGATGWGSPRSSWVRPTSGRLPCSASPGRCSAGSSTQTTHNAHLAVLHGRDVLYVIEERAPGRPLLVTDVGVRLPATLTASGLAMLAPAARGPGAGAVPAPRHPRPARRARAHLGQRAAARADRGPHARLRARGRLGQRRAVVGGARGPRPHRAPRGRCGADLPPGRGRRGRAQSRWWPRCPGPPPRCPPGSAGSADIRPLSCQTRRATARG